MRFCLFLIVAFRLGAATFYIDFGGGNDANNGTSKATAWQHVKGMTGCTGTCASHSVLSTDQFIFKGGVVWTNAAMPWHWTAGNTNTPNVGMYPGVYLGYDPTWNSGTVVSIRPTSSGYNCTSLTVNISGGGGSGAAATANFQTSNYLAGLLQHVTITNAGSGYTSNPTVTFSGSCAVFPTAVADIYSPVMDVSGTTWNESNGVQAGFGPIVFGSVNYLTVDHIEFRGMRVDHTIAGGSGTLWLLTQQSGDHTVWQNIYVHNVAPDVINTSGSPSFNGTGLFSLNQGLSSTSLTVQNSYFDNYESEVFVPCGFTSGVAANFTPPCGSSQGVSGATTLTGNIIHDSRGQVYSPALNSLNYSGNLIWDTTYDCCGQHEDTFYFFGAGVIYNNILHDAAPLGAANFYIETCQNNPCTVGNTTYLFNNIVWNVGQSTPPIGFTSEFWGTSTVSPSPALYAYNNTLYAKGGTVDCINAGQWFGNSSSSTVNFTLQNNHCISDQSGSHWYDSNGGNFGTWNGLANPNNSGTQSVIDAANTVMSPSTATSQGYTFSNSLAPTLYTNSTVSASGTNLTSSCSGSLTVLCSDINSVQRAITGNWQSGAYWFTAIPGAILSGSAQISGGVGLH